MNTETKAGNLLIKRLRALFSAAVLLAAPAAGDVVIHEINAAGWDGQPEGDWIELANTGPGAVNLEGWSLSDDDGRPAKWIFPNTPLPAGEYLLVRATGADQPDPDSPWLETGFKLNAAGEYLGLFNASGETADELAPAFPGQRHGISYGRDEERGVRRYFIRPTPGAANAGTSYAGITPPPVFSLPHGFYDAPAETALTAEDPDALIYYTLDFSVPGPENGLLYTAPIPVTGTTVIRAAAFREDWLPSETRTQTYLNTEQVISQPRDPEGFPEDWNGVKAVYYMNFHIVEDPLYAPVIKDSLKQIPTLSVVMETENLFGPDGIYSRPQETGRGWERPASIEFFSADGAESFQINAGARIAGGASRNPEAAIKHALRFYFRSEYGPGELRYGLFGEDATDEFEVLLARARFNFSWALAGNSWSRERALYVRDAYVQETQRAMGLAGTHQRPVHLYLNGLYWGLYRLHEQLDASFMSSYLGGEPEDWDVVKHIIPRATDVEVKDGNREAWDTAIGLAQKDLSVDANYRALGQYVDIVNLIDYVLITIQTGNMDGITINIPHLGLEGAGNNWYGARNRNDPQGKFQFFNWDSEFAIAFPWAEKIDLEGTHNPASFYAPLRGNAEFRLLFADRVYKHMFHGGALSGEKNLARFLALTNEIYGPVVAESARWGRGFTRDAHWAEERAYLLEEFFPVRNSIVMEQLRSRGLFPPIDPPKLNQFGGPVKPGFLLAMSAPEGTDIYYTLDGTDPRQHGGDPHPDARLYAGPFAMEHAAELNTRAKKGDTWSALAQTVFFPGQDYASLRISEIMYHPPERGGRDGDWFEFIELHNTGTETLSLGGVRFTDGITFAFPTGAALDGGGYLVLAADADSFSEKYPGIPAAGVYQGRLRNGGERVALADPAGGLLFEADYGDTVPWPATPDGGGYSLVLKNPAATPAVSLPGHWRASSQPGGSPAAEDPPPDNPADIYFDCPASFASGWRWSPWLGWFQVDAFPWVFHTGHRWLYAAGPGVSSFWFYDLSLGWLWTRPGVYPFLYQPSSGGWLYYFPESKDPRWFYRCENNEVFPVKRPR